MNVCDWNEEIMARVSKKGQLDKIEARVKKLYENYPENMEPFIGENYLDRKILVVDCCLEVDANEYESDCLNDMSYYSIKKFYHFKQSVKEKADEDSSVFSLKNVLKALDSNLDKESVIYHSFVIRPIKKNDQFENYFPTKLNQNIDEDVVSLWSELTDVDEKESAKMLLQLIHACRPRLIIFLGTPLHVLFYQSLLKIESEDLKVGDSLKQWIEYSKDQTKENAKCFVDSFFNSKSIGTYFFNGFIYLKKDNNENFLYPLELKENTDSLIDEVGKAVVEENKIHPLYEEFDFLLDELNDRFENIIALLKDGDRKEERDNIFLLERIEFEDILEKVDVLVRRMLTENLDKDKFDNRANNRGNSQNKDV